MPAPRRFQWWYIAVLLAVATLVLTWISRVGRTNAEPTAAQAKDGMPHPAGELPRVETVRPVQGGLARRTAQPGSAHSFESAELYAKISGFLKLQHVDIGSRVKQGDLLAEIDVPELTEDVNAATAALEQAKAEVAQAESQVESATADYNAAQSRIAQMKSDVERWQAEVGLAQKQYDRIKELNELDGVEDRLVEERQFQLHSAQASQRAAQSAVVAAEQQAAAANSRIALARAELQVCRAKVTVAESQFNRAKVMLSYTRITSPYDGVVTCRNFHRGAYVRSPDHGGQVPLLAVDRTDHMRVLVRIPERDVPFVQAGDKAMIRFDALPQREFAGAIARIAESEDAATRTMLAEVDLPNTDGVIRDHMYGRVEIALDESLAGVTIPSTCLVGDVALGQAKVFVLKGGQVSLRQVQVGKDTGIEVEILSGLSPEDQIVLRPSGSLTDGMKVASIAAVAQAAKTN
jgi:HlyD family secretion protein